MAHTQRDRAKLTARIRRIKGQLEAVERALDAENECGEVLQLIAAARGAMNGLMGQLLEDHLRMHVLDSDDLISVVRTYLK
ncbi:MAG: metal/formaldehyde-sensitive transcriptional repressor [Candidatus Eremiobacteraeota bacterium]|nr:metal/formaldehyde-sensitive transcriptional repressor [Candidatus Eremiobacteraeota bacterium]MDQ2864795.1 metal/formaldehyde-sensitive transcriptional repressor [Candidatus Eremiobacteraeota bacterium]